MSGLPDYRRNGPCPCGTSSDAFRRHAEGSGWCFSGNCTRKSRYVSARELNGDEPEVRDDRTPDGPISYQYLDHRGISKHTFEKYLTPVKVVGENPTTIGFPYTKEATKVRGYDNKKFFWQGKITPGCFGKLTFPEGSFDDIIITEGEYDAPAAYQMVGGKRLAAISVQSAVTAIADCRADQKYINSAKRIFLSFDSDEPGQKAAISVASLFDFKKIFKIEHGRFKDANEFLVADAGAEYRAAFQSARKFTPDGVISSYEDILTELKSERVKPVVDLPFKELEKKLEGLRFGTSVLFSGREGIGKTEILRKLQHHVLKSTDYNVGIIHLEEPKDTTINTLLAYEAELPIRRSEIDIPVEERLKHYQNMTKRDNRVFIYSHFGSDNPDDFLGIVRYLVATCECKFIFFDHINFIVSQMNIVVDERRTLDYIGTKLSKLAEELDFCLVFVCHENDNGETRGSRNIGQTAHVRVRLSRDIENTNPIDGNKLYMSIAKNRPTSQAGPAGYAYYDDSIGCLVDGVPLEQEMLPRLET